MAATPAWAAPAQGHAPDHSEDTIMTHSDTATVPLTLASGLKVAAAAPPCGDREQAGVLDARHLEGL